MFQMNIIRMLGSVTEGILDVSRTSSHYGRRQLDQYEVLGAILAQPSGKDISLPAFQPLYLIETVEYPDRLMLRVDGWADW